MAFTSCFTYFNRISGSHLYLLFLKLSVSGSCFQNRYFQNFVFYNYIEIHFQNSLRRLMHKMHEWWSSLNEYGQFGSHLILMLYCTDIVSVFHLLLWTVHLHCVTPCYRFLFLFLFYFLNWNFVFSQLCCLSDNCIFCFVNCWILN